MIILNEDPRYWTGCLAPSKKERRAPLLSSVPSAPDPALFTWSRWCLPSINQSGPSCVGQSWANWLECMVRRYVPPARIKSLIGEFMGGYTSRWQIDGDKLWAAARKYYYGGSMNGGLTLAQGGQAMQRLGWMPAGADLVEVDQWMSWKTIGVSLLSTPLVQAHRVHSGWFDANPGNGCINHLPAPKDSDGAHATLLIGRLVQDKKNFYLSMNSWGTEWGMGGYFVMTEEESIEGWVGFCPMTFATNNFATWEGWVLGLRHG